MEIKPNKWNVVCPSHIIDALKKTTYFKRDMGSSLTMIDERSKKRELREGYFPSFYYTKLNRTINKSGVIGSLDIYLDYNILTNEVYLFLKSDNNRYFSYEWNTENNIDMTLSAILVDADTKISKGIYNEHSEDKVEDTTVVNKGEAVILSPGTATWEDIKAYIKNKKSEKK